MHRFYLPSEACKSDVFSLTEQDAHHARSVLRILKDEEIHILDGAGRTIVSKIIEVNKKSVILARVSDHFTPPLPCKTVLYQAIPKAKLIEDIIEKATELGVAKIVPLLSERVVSRFNSDEADVKQKKWQSVAVEAIKQCGSPWLPLIAKPISLEAALSAGPRCDFEMIGALEPNSFHLKTAIQDYRQRSRQSPSSAAYWVGPEGDFTEQERTKIKGSGAYPVTLGRLILRCETAAVYGLSVLNHEFQA